MNRYREDMDKWRKGRLRIAAALLLLCIIFTAFFVCRAHSWVEVAVAGAFAAMSIFWLHEFIETLRGE